jgi:hypothetical protein
VLTSARETFGREGKRSAPVAATRRLTRVWPVAVAAAGVSRALRVYEDVGHSASWPRRRLETTIAKDRVCARRSRKRSAPFDVVCGPMILGANAGLLDLHDRRVPCVSRVPQPQTTESEPASCAVPMMPMIRESENETRGDQPQESRNACKSRRKSRERYVSTSSPVPFGPLQSLKRS